MLTGHGSFDHFLWRIGKREEASCFHCAHPDDTLEHTLSDCRAWSDHRDKLVRELGLNIGSDITLGRIVERILIKKEYWYSFVYFSTVVLKLKEEEERRREGEILSIPLSPS